MQITRKVALEVAHHEAVVRQAYKDSVGVWTWSVGLTDNSGHNVTRYIGKPQTIDHCIEVFMWALKRYADDVNRAFAGHDLTEAQFAAALSFHWNTGAIGRAAWVSYFVAGNKNAAKKAFMNWVTPKSITARRKAERDLFFSGRWAGNGKMLEFTRLKPGSTPDWESGVKIDVSAAIDAALGLSPAATPPPSGGGWPSFFTAIINMFRKGRS